MLQIHHLSLNYAILIVLVDLSYVFSYTLTTSTAMLSNYKRRFFMRHQIDWSATAAWIALAISIISPAITTIHSYQSPSAQATKARYSRKAFQRIECYYQKANNIYIHFCSLLPPFF
jgi:hypothetical protein